MKQKKTKNEKRNERMRLVALVALGVVSMAGLAMAPGADAGWTAWLWAAAGWATSIASGWLALRLTAKWTAAGKLPSVERYLGED